MNTFQVYHYLGASIYDVRKIFRILDPIPPCPQLGLIYSTKFTQPPLLHHLLGQPPSSLIADVINRSPLTWDLIILVIMNSCESFKRSFIWYVIRGP